MATLPSVRNPRQAGIIGRIRKYRVYNRRARNKRERRMARAYCRENSAILNWSFRGEGGEDI